MTEHTVTVTADDLESVSAKLNALDLTEPERAALAKLFVMASEAAGDDVSGFDGQGGGNKGFHLGGIVKPGILNLDARMSVVYANSIHD
ncbi:MAG: hypothetical protein ACR2OD_01350 [Gaiellaceae bacterium]